MYSRIKKSHESAIVVDFGNSIPNSLFTRHTDNSSPNPIIYSESSLIALENNDTLRYEKGTKEFKEDVASTQRKYVMISRHRIR